MTARSQPAQSKRQDKVRQRLMEAASCHASGNYDDAIAICRNILKDDPGQSDALNLIGASFLGLNRAEDALRPLQKLVERRPDHAGGHFNLAVAFGQLEQADNAIRHYRKAIELRPQDFAARNNLGQMLTETGALDDAIAELREALRLRPDFALAHRNLGAALLLKGDLPEGFREYAWRWRTGETKPRSFSAPVWDGVAPLDGGILVHAEQGLGDTLQFCRYLTRLPVEPDRVALLCQPQLKRLLQHSLPGFRIIGPKDALPSFTHHAALLDIPLLLGTDLATIPADVPYLSAEAARVALWRDRLKSKSGYKIGICWQGNPKGNIDRGRSFPLAAYAPLAGLDGLRLISLQKDAGVEQLTSAPAGLIIETLGEDFDAGQDAFIDSAAVMMNLDLVITSDTSIAHLAGALGRPVWLALKFVPDWRWIMGRDDSPWYPSMRLFRQTTPGDWAGVFKRIAEALKFEFPSKGPKS